MTNAIAGFDECVVVECDGFGLQQHSTRTKPFKLSNWNSIDYEWGSRTANNVRL